MFITLKRPARHGSSEMEQVVSRDAISRADQTRLRMGRRPACLSCQARKLRCSGRIGDCDGCRSRSIACLPSSNAVKPSTTVHPSSPRPVLGHSRQKARSRSPRNPAGSDTAHRLVNSASRRDAGPDPLAQGEDSSARELLNNSGSSIWAAPNPWPDDPTTANLDHDISAALVDIEEFAQGHPPAGSNDGGFDADAMQYDFGDIQPRSAQSLPTSTPALSESPDKSVMANDATGNQTMENVETDLQIPTNSRIQSEPSSSSSSSTLPDVCNCLYNTVRVVQQLDDDDFRITSMTLGQVSQLQKWIMTQCYKALDCATCKSLSPVHTVLMVVCDRLAEMFECIHKRIKKANQRLTGLSVSSDESPAPGSPTDQSGEQLFCATSHRPAARARCNPEIFSSDFQTMYTNEEQVHMIRALLKLQVRNFRTLLTRIKNASQFVEARRSRVEALNSRLVRAANDMENALRASLLYFALGSSQS